MDAEKKRFFTAVSVLVGTSIGAGVLAIPYVAAQAGFFVALAYIVVLGLLVFVVNLYFGEVILRTKGDHQIAGYAGRYLGRKGKIILEFATIFGIYAATIAYMFGIGESLSFLIFKNSDYTLFFGVVFGIAMSGLLWKGIKSLKKFEKIGVLVILALLVAIFVIFFKDINFINFYSFNIGNIFLPFGVILFALMSFYAIPELQIILHKNEKQMRKVLITGTAISVIFYSIFAFVVVGVKGIQTPEIATLALGEFFVFLGIFTLFTSYLSLGNALLENLMYDERLRKSEAWFLTSIIPIFLFVFIRIFDFLSFTKILSVGGVVSGGLIAVSVLFMVKKAKEKGNRKPEYSVPVNWFIILFLSLIFATGVFMHLV